METQFINLNMTPMGINPCFHVSQYDIGRSLGFMIYNGSEVVDLDSYTCTIEATRSDGVAITASVTTDDNIGTFETTATMTNKADKYRAQFVIVDGDSNRIASLPFDMDVVKAAMDENSESIEEDASLYQQYTEAVQGAIAEVNADIQEEENARIAAVNAEATARANADATLQTNIDAEATARANAINSEATARQTADNTLQSNINSEASTRATQDGLLQSQIDQIIAPSGEAPSAAEVQNARIGADGVTYDTLGNAIRGQVSDLKSTIGVLTGTKTSGHYITKISGFDVTNASYCYFTIDVSKMIGMRVHIFTYLGGDATWAVFGGANNKPLIHGSGESSLDYYDYVITIPATALTLRVSCTEANYQAFHARVEDLSATVAELNGDSIEHTAEISKNATDIQTYSPLKISNYIDSELDNNVLPFCVPIFPNANLYESAGAVTLIDDNTSLSGKCYRITGTSVQITFSRSYKAGDKYFTIRYKSTTNVNFYVAMRNASGGFVANHITDLLPASNDWVIKTIQIPAYSDSSCNYNIILNAISDISINYIALSETAKEIMGIDHFSYSILNKPTAVSTFKKALCIGDSITQGIFNVRTPNVGELLVQGKSYPSYFQKIANIETTNAGDAGKSSVQWYAAHSSDDFSGHDLCIIELGINDPFRGNTVTEGITAITNIINLVKTANTNIKIFLCTIPPAYCNIANANFAYYTEFNDVLKATFASTENVYILDIAEKSAIKPGTPYVQGHLTAIGYEQMANEIQWLISETMKNNINDFKNIQFIGTDLSY